MENPSAITKYETFLNERLMPDYNEAIRVKGKLVTEMREYETLLVTIATMERLKKSEKTRLKTLVDLGKHFFAEAISESNEKIIVRVVDDLFVELSLERATKFVEKRIRLLEDRAKMADDMASRVKTHIDLVLASLDEHAALEKQKTV